MVKALYDTRELKQILYRLKYLLTKPDVVTEIDHDCFPHWQSLGFIDTTRPRQGPKTTVKRRKSIDSLFTEANLKLLDGPSAQASEFLQKLKDSNGPKAGNFGSFGLPVGLRNAIGQGDGMRDAEGIKTADKRYSDGQIKRNAQPAVPTMLPKNQRVEAEVAKAKKIQEIADVRVDSNFSSNDNLFRSNDSREIDVKVNPDLLFTMDDKPALGKKFNVRA